MLVGVLALVLRFQVRAAGVPARVDNKPPESRPRCGTGKWPCYIQQHSQPALLPHVITLLPLPANGSPSLQMALRFLAVQRGGGGLPLIGQPRTASRAVREMTDKRLGWHGRCADATFLSMDDRPPPAGRSPSLGFVWIEQLFLNPDVSFINFLFKK